MSISEREIISKLVMRLRALLVEPEFGTVEQANEIEDIADELTLLTRIEPNERRNCE